MKNIKKALVLGLAFLGVGAITSCDNKKADDATQVTDASKEAIEKVLLPQNDTTVTGDFSLVSTVKYNGETVKVTWKSSNNLVKIVEADGKISTQIAFKENLDKAVDVTLTAEVKIGDTTAAKTFKITVPQYKIYSIAEADEAKKGDSLVIKGVVVAKETYDSTNKTTNVYLSAENGGFEAYKLSCTKEQYDNELTQGTTIIVSGLKSYYNGLRELTPASYDLTKDAKVTVPVEDLTSLVTAGTGISNAYQCHVAKLTDVEIISIGDTTADSYSIVVGDKDDVKKQITVRIASGVTPKNSDARKEFDGLKLIPGQKITVTGFVGWYNVAQITPFAKGQIVAGEKKPYDEIGYTLLDKVALPPVVYGAKTFVLPSTLVEAGLSGDKFDGYTIEWSKTSANVTLGTKDVAAKAATDKTPAVPAYTTTTVTTAASVAADENVELTLTVKDSTGAVKFTGKKTVKLIKEVTVNTHAEYLAAKAGDYLTIEGTIAYLDKEASSAYFSIVDDQGNAYYVYGLSLTDENKNLIVAGKKVALYGVKGLYNKGHQLAAPTGLKIEVLRASDGTAVEPATITELAAVTPETQAKYVTFTGKIKTLSSNKRTITVTVGEGDAAKDITVYVSRNQNSSIPSNIAVGQTITVKGITSVNNDASQVITLTTDALTITA